MEESLFRNRVTVIEGLALLQNSDNDGTTFTFKATVTGIRERSTWFYMACPKCNKAHIIVKGIPWCNGCDKRVRNPVARYKLELKVTDKTTTDQLLNHSSTM